MLRPPLDPLPTRPAGGLRKEGKLKIYFPDLYIVLLLEKEETEEVGIKTDDLLDD